MAYNPPDRLYNVQCTSCLCIYFRSSEKRTITFFPTDMVHFKFNTSSLVQIVPMVHITSPSNELSKNYPPCNVDGKRLVGLNWRCIFVSFPAVLYARPSDGFLRCFQCFIQSFKSFRSRWTYDGLIMQRKEEKKSNASKSETQIVSFCVHTPNGIEGLSNDSLKVLETTACSHRILQGA